MRLNFDYLRFWAKSRPKAQSEPFFLDFSVQFIHRFVYNSDIGPNIRFFDRLMSFALLIVDCLE
jgi:hypothetical protein